MKRPYRWLTFRWQVIAVVGLVALISSGLGRPVAAQEDESIRIALNEYDESGVSGTATLDAAGTGTGVSMELSGDPVVGDHPTHIHTGTCDDFDPNPLYPLTTVILDDVDDEGVSDTTVEDVSLDELLDDDYVILVHKSHEELTNYFVCGEIKVTSEDGAEEIGTGGRMTFPKTGSGMTTNAGEFDVPAILAASAILVTLWAAGLTLRRRPTN